MLVLSLDDVTGCPGWLGSHRVPLACEECRATAQRCEAVDVRMLTILCWTLAYRLDQQQVKSQIRTHAESIRLLGRIAFPCDILSARQSKPARFIHEKLHRPSRSGGAVGLRMLEQACATARRRPKEC